MLELALRAEVVHPDGEKVWEDFPFLVSEDEELGEAVVSTLMSLQKRQLDLHEDERTSLDVVIDKRAPLEKSITVSVLDEEGERHPLPLDWKCGEADLEDGMFLLLERGTLDVGARPFRPARGQVPERQRHFAKDHLVESSRSDPESDSSQVKPSSTAGSDAEMRARRIRLEVEDFMRVVEANPERLKVYGPNPLRRVWTRSEPLRFEVRGIKGWVTGDDGQPVLSDSHGFEVVFPTGYPFLRPFRVLCSTHGKPLFHPNVDPDRDRYVCLFVEEVASHRRTLVDALMRLVLLIRWDEANLHGVHAMNKRAMALYDDPSSGMRNVASRGLDFPIG